MRKSFYDDVERYSIKQTAKLTGISEKTLRYYDEAHFVSPLYRNSENKYRYYTIKQFYQLENLKIAKSLGLPMKDYLSIQAKASEIDQADFSGTLSSLAFQVEEHKRRMTAIQREISVLEMYQEKLTRAEGYLKNGAPYQVRRDDACLLIIPMSSSNCFEETSRRARTLVQAPEYADSVTPFWGVLLDAEALARGQYRIAYQYCRLNRVIEDKNTLNVPGGTFDTIVGRGWMDEVLAPLAEYLHTHPSKDPYIVAEEIALFDEVDSIHHEIFIRRA